MFDDLDETLRNPLLRGDGVVKSTFTEGLFYR